MGKSLGDTLTALARYRRALHPASGGGDGDLIEIEAGANPGKLRLLALLPPHLPPHAPLVVVLHGCTQTAWGFARESGWADLASRCGFALLVPEQVRANNAGLCFNWFEPGLIVRGGAEVESVAIALRTLLTRRGLDARRVFLCGLSAGAAFGNALLAAYPELFAAGGLVAGLPFGVTTGTKEAMAAMNGSRALSEHDLLMPLPKLPPGAHWPAVEIWHGAADTIVVPANARAAVRQWLALHGIAESAGVTDRLGPATRTLWCGKDGAPAVTEIMLPGFGHAVPLSLHDADPARRVGAAGPYAIEAGLSASATMAQSWGLLAGAPPAHAAPATPLQPPPARPGVKAIIERALKAAGLSH